MFELSDEDLIRIFGPLISFFLALIGTVYKFRKPLWQFVNVAMKYIPMLKSKTDEKLKLEIESLKKEIESSNKLAGLLRGDYAGSRFVRQIKFERTPEDLFLYFQFFKDIKLTIEDLSLSFFLIEIGAMLRQRKDAVKKLTLDFYNLDFINSKGIGNIYSFFVDFKENNGFQLIVILPKDNRSKVSFGPIHDLAKSITDMKIEAIPEEVVSP